MEKLRTEQERAQFQFRAQPCNVLYSAPFEPEKPHRVAVPDAATPLLVTKTRAHYRKVGTKYFFCGINDIFFLYQTKALEQTREQARAQQEQLEEQRQAERQREDQQKLASHRASLVHKALPVPNLRPVPIQKSNIPLTVPKTPNFTRK